MRVQTDSILNPTELTITASNVDPSFQKQEREFIRALRAELVAGDWSWKYWLGRFHERQAERAAKSPPAKRKPKRKKKA